MTDSAPMADNDVLQQEQAHLDSVYAELVAMRDALEAKIARTDEQAAADKAAMADDLSLNLAAYDDAMEMYAAFATVDKVIEGYNLSQQVSAQKLSDVNILLEGPYFAKLALEFSDSGMERELYIGTVGIVDEDRKQLVVDWRSPVAEVYYNQAMGPTTYDANGRTIAVDLKLRRQFDLVRDHLRACFDTTVAIEDPLLLASLSEERSSHMRSITATIQREQNAVIRHEDVPTLMVSGIAGSGKTSVLMQRIAYLFYRQRDELSPDQVVLMTPNPVFARYIADVLPDMGEANPQTLTWESFAAATIAPDRAHGNLEVDPAELARIDRGIPTLQLTPHDLREVRVEGVRFTSANQAHQLLDRFGNVPMGPRRIALVREELLRKAQARMTTLARREEVRDEMAALPIDEQIALFHETVEGATEEDEQRMAMAYVRAKYGEALQAIENDEWLKVDRIGMGLLDAPGLNPITWLYTKMALTGCGDANARYVMVDEVQDYTMAQLLVLARYYRRAHFMMLGDENQAIQDGRATFEQIAAGFESVRGPVATCELLTSYRSTPEVTALFERLAKTGGKMRIASVQREGTPPAIEAFDDDASYERALRQALEDMARDEGLTALIATHGGGLRRLRAMLGDAMPPTIGPGDALPESGTVALTLKLAKGLEFDRVVVADASAAAFPDDDLSRRRLYTTISRATKEVRILSRGPLTKLLA